MLKGQLNGRLHDLIQFRGGSQTGRYAGRRVQVQNLPRLEISDDEVELLIYLFRKQDRDRIRFLFGDVFYAAKQLLRPMLGSPNGLIVSDFAQVEARVVAWVAGQLDTLESFTDENRDPYKEMASSIYAVSVDEVTDWQRFIGKMCVLGAGFGLGGRGFYNQLSQRGIEITEEEGQAAIDAYRAKNPKIVNFWYRVEDAMRYVIAHPGESQAVNELIEFESADQGELGVCVKLRLPSGRCLFYMSCRFVDDPDSDHKPRVVFRGSDWDDETTYGGKIVENLVQAIANDLLNHALLELDRAAYEIVMHVHDEAVVQNVSELDVGKINTIMESAPKWAVGFPLKAETKFCKINRYTK